LSKTPAGKPRDAELSDLSQDDYPKSIKLKSTNIIYDLLIFDLRFIVKRNHWRFVSSTQAPGWALASCTTSVYV